MVGIVSHDLRNDELRLSFPNVELDRPDAPLGTVYLDADRIHQLVGNLVANAVMYGAPGRPVLTCFSVRIPVDSRRFPVSTEKLHAPPL
jgi:signal transduction histidine kinase